jgi:hypothetical protein
VISYCTDGTVLTELREGGEFGLPLNMIYTRCQFERCHGQDGIALRLADKIGAVNLSSVVRSMSYYEDFLLSMWKHPLLREHRVPRLWSRGGLVSSLPAARGPGARGVWWIPLRPAGMWSVTAKVS